MYKIEYSKLIQCSQKDIDQASQQTQLTNELESPTSVLLSDRCAIFFNDVEKSSITCADATKAIDSKNKAVIASDPIYLQYVSGMKIRQNKLFVLSSTFFRHLEGPLNANEINFRLFSVPMEEIKRNTNCFSSCNS
ncbi:PREDICTED: major royal jelly protein 2-like [Vollenhovia emeryi]|uniref:major royal jelly protein 2-like n=1 Tax=Vollenhovia emeryi TaxID=411798 RepID=UPI0005F3E9A3|nr:PREDICTED: major royal jelly protein 2-like [Vollenhovia emeryi]XP_011880240.1 PREDICTED: major royal jelly protein 2-like [Vollenhovia emeryi]